MNIIAIQNDGVAIPNEATASMNLSCHLPLFAAANNPSTIAITNAVTYAGNTNDIVLGIFARISSPTLL